MLSWEKGLSLKVGNFTIKKAAPLKVRELSRAQVWTRWIPCGPLLTLSQPSPDRAPRNHALTWRVIVWTPASTSAVISFTVKLTVLTNLLCAWPEIQSQAASSRGAQSRSSRGAAELISAACRVGDFSQASAALHYITYTNRPRCEVHLAAEFLMVTGGRASLLELLWDNILPWL